MPADRHDRLVAFVSHLPQVASTALMSLAATEEADEPEILLLAAGGFRDLTRLAASDAALWSSILLANRERIAEAIDLYVDRLHRLRDAVACDLGCEAPGHDPGDEESGGDGEEDPGMSLVDGKGNEELLQPVDQEDERRRSEPHPDPDQCRYGEEPAHLPLCQDAYCREAADALQRLGPRLREQMANGKWQMEVRMKSGSAKRAFPGSQPGC